MKVRLEWNRPPSQISGDITGERAQLFMANEAKRLMDPYVPADELALAQNVTTYTEKGRGIVEYRSPYAHYQYVGEVYVSSITGSAWSHGEYKVPSGRDMVHSKFRHPLATSEWDKAMLTARRGDLVKAMQNYVRRGGKG